MFFVAPGFEQPNLDTRFFVDPPALVAYEQQCNQPAFSAIELGVRDILQQIAATIPDAGIRGKFLDPALSTRELVKALSKVDPAARVECITKLFDLARGNTEAAEFVEDKIDNAVGFCTPAERSEIVKQLLKQGSSRRDREVALVLQSSDSLETLRSILGGCDRVQLQKAGYKTADIVALCDLFTELRKASFDGLSGDDICTKLEGYERLCREDVSWRNSEPAREMLKALSSTRESLCAELAKAGNDENLRSDVATRYAKICAMEFRYGVRVTTGQSDLLDVITGDIEGIDTVFLWGASQPVLSEAPVSWTLGDLGEIEEVLNAIPEGALIFSPRLCDIELVPSLGWGVLGARYSADGKIKIASWTRGNADFAKEYDGVSALKIVLAHEIGHGLQIGAGPSGIETHGKHGPHFEGGEARYDFDEYLSIAGWEVISPERFKTDLEKETVTLDGNPIPLGSPVTIDGKPYVFTYFADQNILICYRADGEFSQRWYAKASPWEDFAEAFAEYIFLPERLMKNAPHKFQHLNEEFGKYSVR